ncbi:chitosanase [Actinoplanes missouriensis]|uniref:chitosanase n=1 Tax=Actinoplanes missouriensis TaxID=1866 RepID=UPI0033F36204
MSRVKTVVYALSGLALTSAATVYGLLPAGAATAGPIKGLGGKCIDVAGAATANGTAIQLYDCNNSAAQQWTVDGTLQALGKCMDITAAGTTNGTKIQLYECNGTGAQKWTLTGGALVNPASGKCLDVTGGSTANGTRLQIWTCSGTAGQAWTPPGSAGAGKNLDDPAKKDVAMQIVSAAENSSLNWRAQFSYIEDINDGRGYTAGIIGFCSGTGDMLELVEAYTATNPSNVLAKYLPALRSVNGTASHAGLDPNFTRDWRTAAADPAFQAAQEAERDRVYFNPSVRDGKSDGVRALGQFAYYDAAVVHGYSGMRSIRSRALAKAKPPAQGGDERAWLTAFLNERVIEMKKEPAHEDVTRIDTAQRVFLNNGNFDLNTPLDFKVYGDAFHIS